MSYRRGCVRVYNRAFKIHPTTPWQPIAISVVIQREQPLGDAGTRLEQQLRSGRQLIIRREGCARALSRIDAARAIN